MDLVVWEIRKTIFLTSTIIRHTPKYRGMSVKQGVYYVVFSNPKMLQPKYLGI